MMEAFRQQGAQQLEAQKEAARRAGFKFQPGEPGLSDKTPGTPDRFVHEGYGLSLSEPEATWWAQNQAQAAADDPQYATMDLPQYIALMRTTGIVPPL
jgi:hypothetical protein